MKDLLSELGKVERNFDVELTPTTVPNYEESHRIGSMIGVLGLIALMAVAIWFTQFAR